MYWTSSLLNPWGRIPSALRPAGMAWSPPDWDPGATGMVLMCLWSPPMPDKQAHHSQGPSGVSAVHPGDTRRVGTHLAWNMVV